MKSMFDIFASYYEIVDDISIFLREGVTVLDSSESDLIEIMIDLGTPFLNYHENSYIDNIDVEGRIGLTLDGKEIISAEYVRYLDGTENLNYLGTVENPTEKYFKECLEKFKIKALEKSNKAGLEGL